MKNLELFDRLAVKFHDRILFVKGTFFSFFFVSAKEDSSLWFGGFDVL